MVAAAAIVVAADWLFGSRSRAREVIPEENASGGRCRC